MVGTLTYMIGAIMQLVFFFFYLLILRVCPMWHRLYTIVRECRPSAKRCMQLTHSALRHVATRQ